MEKLYPIVRRVRRPLLPQDEVASREGAKGTCVPATALRAENEAAKPVEEVSGETPAITPETGVLPEDKE
jgi:hypothetical protein